MERIKYYSVIDMSGGLMLANIEKIISNKSEFAINNINDAIEAFNIFRFTQDELRLQQWEEGFYIEYCAFGKSLLSSGSFRVRMLTGLKAFKERCFEASLFLPN